MKIRKLIKIKNLEIFQFLFVLAFCGLSAACGSQLFSPTQTGVDSSKSTPVSGQGSIVPALMKTAGSNEGVQPRDWNYKNAEDVTASTKFTKNIPAMRKSYDSCINAAGGVTSAMQDCITVEYKYQDDRLNFIYKDLMAKLDDAKKHALREQQRQWIVDRDAKCYYDPDSGQAGRLDAAECRLEMTARRAENLEER